MFERWLRLSAAVIAVAFASTLAAAHDLPANTMMNAFVKIERTQAHLVVRIPLDLLRRAPLPVNAQTQQYDLASSGPEIQEELSALADGLPIWENSVRLVPSISTGRVSLPSDRSFEDYDRAVTAADRPTDTTEGLGYGLGYFDAHFIYPISSPK